MQTMKIVRSSLVALAVAVTAGFGTMAQAATTATANASAVILTPISIAKNVDLSFGDVYPDTAATGTVSVDPATGARTAGGAAALGTTPGAAAQFTVSGQANATYAITLPAAAITLTSGGGATMTVDTFATDGTGTLDATGNEIIHVGANLNVGIGQAAGTYTGTFDVTVNYN